MIHLQPPKEDNLSITNRMARFHIAPKLSASWRFHCT